MKKITWNYFHKIEQTRKEKKLEKKLKKFAVALKKAGGKCGLDYINIFTDYNGESTVLTVSARKKDDYAVNCYAIVRDK